MRVIKVVLLVIVGFTSISGCSHQEGANIVSSDLEASKFKDAVDKKEVVVVDVRTPKEFDAGSIPGAISIDFLDGSFTENINSLDKRKPIYVYCASGNRSSKAQNIFVKNGFEKVYNLNGGFKRWKELGYPIKK